MKKVFAMPIICMFDGIKIYGNTDKFLCCATLPRKITIEKDNKR